MVSKYTLEKIPNPVKDDYEGKKARLRVFQGFYTYLFRRRMDTGSNKYEEISDLVHKYGTERIGEDYSVFVTGHRYVTLRKTGVALIQSHKAPQSIASVRA